MKTLCLTVVVLLSVSCNCGAPSGPDGGSGGGTGHNGETGGSGATGGGSAGGSATGGGSSSGGGVGTGGGMASGGGTSNGGGSTSGGGSSTGGGSEDAGHYDCASFTSPSGWTTAPGFRAVVFATLDAGLSQPVALEFARGAYGGKLFVVNQGNNTILRLDPATGAGEPFSQLDGGPATQLLTTITWDSRNQFDGQLYVGDQGSDGDGDSHIYRLAPDGAMTGFAAAPGAGLDDIYGMVFTPQLPGWPSGLLVAGDTDNTYPGPWGVVNAQGVSAYFSSLGAVQGFAVDPTQYYGAAVLAARPASGGFSGDDAVIPVFPDGDAGVPIVRNIPGIHAVTIAPAGPFQGKAFAASWSSGRVFSLELDGGTTNVASGLQLSNYDGNILAFSPDGRVLMVADRLANRVVCIEPVP